MNSIRKILSTNEILNYYFNDKDVSLIILEYVYPTFINEEDNQDREQIFLKFLKNDQHIIITKNDYGDERMICNNNICKKKYKTSYYYSLYNKIKHIHNFHKTLYDKYY